jgi:serine/threonine-protein kinase RsbW
MHREFSIPADVNVISDTVDEIVGFLREQGFAKGNEFAIEISLREALANAVLHGCKNDRSKKIHCAVECRHNREVRIIVTDPGDGFDPDSIADPLHSDNLHNDHGRGVYLIRQLMDSVEYAQGGREVRMTKS